MIRKGTQVTWKWGNSNASGEVKDVFHSDTTKEIKGSKVKREASEEKPAYLIEQDDGQIVLKSSTEVQRA